MSNRQKPPRWGKFLDSVLFYLLVAAIVGMLGWLSLRYNQSWDWTTHSRNSLSPISQTLLDRLNAPLKIRSFAPENPSLRQQIAEVIGRYQRYRPDIELLFINPALEPALTRELGIQVAGELVIEYQGKRENLSDLDETSIANTLQRLLQQGDRSIVSLIGHGERLTDGKANHDLGSFGDKLRKKGHRLYSLDLVKNLQIPDNTGLLVIASPQTALLTGEKQKIAQYIQQGGNLLWLTDPDAPEDLSSLLSDTGLSRLPGTIVDASASDLGLDTPTIAIVTQYPTHPATGNFNQQTLYPAASALQASPSSTWNSTPLLATQERSWNETGPLKGEISRDLNQNEQLGPLALAYAFSRMQAGHQQRLLVIGDGDFLSNAYLGNAGNLNLGLNLLRWLTENDNLLDIPARGVNDNQLTLSPAKAVLIGLGFLFVLPFALFATGTLIWWRRRRR